MIGFEKVAKVDEITQAYPKKVTVGDCECVLFRVGGTNICSRKSLPASAILGFSSGGIGTLYDYMPYAWLEFRCADRKSCIRERVLENI